MTKSEILNSVKLTRIELFKILMELCDDSNSREEIGVHIDNVRTSLYDIETDLEKDVK